MFQKTLQNFLKTSKCMKITSNLKNPSTTFDNPNTYYLN